MFQMIYLRFKAGKNSDFYSKQWMPFSPSNQNEMNEMETEKV